MNIQSFFTKFYLQIHIFLPTFVIRMKKYVIILFLIAILTSCHSSKKVTASDPIYGNTENYSSDGPEQEQEIKINGKQRKAIVKEANKWLGTPYKYAGESRNGTDCSGMVMTIYKDVCGIKLPRNSAKQADFCKKIKKKDLRPGDLLFFATGKDKKKVSHVGIYIGDDKMIHASTSRGVVINKITEQYYEKTFISCGKVVK